MSNSSRAGSRQVQRKNQLQAADEDSGDKHPVPNEYKTLGGKQFFWPQYDKNDKNEDIENLDNLFFICENDKTALGESSVIFIDGTFRIIKNTGFNQLIIISQRQFNNERNKSLAYPVAFIMMKSQQEAAYTKVWDTLESICGKKLTFEKIITDLEVGLQNSLRKKFPSATLVSCSVHIKRAWFRKLQKLGLMSYSKNYQHTFHDHWKIVQSFIYVDVANKKINECCIDLLKDYEHHCNANIKEAVTQFHEYLLKNYINLSDDTRFHPKTWSTTHMPTSSNQMFTDFESSTNVAESLNAALNRMIPKSETFDLVKSTRSIREFKRSKLNDLLYLRTFDKLCASKKLSNVRQILRKK